MTTGIPSPATTFTYRYTQGALASTITRRWETFGETGSRLHMTNSLQKMATLSVTSSHAMNNLIVIDSTSTEGTNAAGAFAANMTYTPGLVDGPSLRVCQGQKWTIPQSTAAVVASPGGKMVDTIEGTGEVISISETITVPAGTFETVHYKQTSVTKNGPVTTNTWRAIKEGVVVRMELAQQGQAGMTSLEVLTAIK